MSADTADTARWLTVTRELLEQPTAPLFEDLPRAHIASLASAGGLAVESDAAGNVLVRYEGEGTRDGRRASLVVVAHLDHPGFTVDSVDADLVHLTFHGGLATDAVTPGSPVHFFAPATREPVGVGHVERADGNSRLSGAVARVEAGEANERGFAMWGFGPWEDDGERIAGRVCDDLVGAAAALCTLLDLARERPADTAVWGLFTRAEEIGFLGTLEAIRLGVIPMDATVLSLECSTARAGARQGDGVIVRVGDRMSIFDPGLTAALCQAAEALAGHDPAFRYQRKLMDGGACEATAFCAAGYRASGLALPLANYHNASDDGPGVAAENVRVDDYVAEIRLLAELARQPGLLDPPAGPPEWLAERTERARRLLDSDR